MSDQLDPAELERWQAVSDGAKSHGWQAFRVTPDFLDRMIARVRGLEKELGDDYDLAAVTELERDQLKARVAELEATVAELVSSAGPRIGELRAELESKTTQAELWMRANEAAEEYFHACSVSGIDLDGLKSEWLSRAECARDLDSAVETASEPEGGS